MMQNYLLFKQMLLKNYKINHIICSFYAGQLKSHCLKDKTE
jgi:hypothetical protein